ncbi:disease resistance protein RGA5-like [Lolium perenne]|uniref:disease resistance protein RGA5-like n=1 Tax=Lolium perenne TaxID=4522 RepID=UPI003A99E60C
MPSRLGFQALRVLAIEDCTFMKDYAFHLENLGRLHQLRYLGLRETPISKLPKEIGELRFLQTIDLWECKNVEALPQSIILLRQLKCLRAGGAACKPISVPDGMGNLTSMEELWLRYVDKCPNFVQELGKLTELRNLNICIELPESWMCKTFVESLGNLQKIQVLSLHALNAKLSWEGYAHDLVTLGEFPELLRLERCGSDNDIPVVMGGNAFHKLRSCNMTAPLRFLPGAMPSLERLEFTVHVQPLKEANFDFDFGSLENLPCLREAVILTLTAAALLFTEIMLMSMNEQVS